MVKPSKPAQALLEIDLSKSWKIVLTTLLVIYLVLSYAGKQNLLTADLGRHIRNGEHFLQYHEPISTNYYSYTQPDFPTRTHHWGAGVIYYVLHKMGGFEALSLLNIFLYMLAFFLFFKIAIEKSNYLYALFFSLLALPLITSRLEIRPEVFSYLFVAIYYYILSRYTDGKLKWQFLTILPLVQILWVNMHILFPLGPFLVGVFTLGELVAQRTESLKKLSIIGGISCLACFVNFFGWEGIVEPFTILNNYGMMIVENQGLGFMLDRRGFPNNLIYIHAIILSIISLTSILILALADRKKIFQHTSTIILLIIFGILAWKMIRNFPLFGFLFIVLSSLSFFEYQKSNSISLKKNLKIFFLAGSCIILFCGFIFPTIQYFRQQSIPDKLKALEKEYKRNPSKKEEIFKKADDLKSTYAALDTNWTLRNYYSPFKYDVGLGLMEGCNKSAEFIKKNKIEGPYFNNYDIGGYFIFHLFPTYRPFIDNRPEAYSVDFFNTMFIPMQEDTSDITWKKFDEQYHFNAIFFYRHDQTPYGQPFLIRRIKDPSWIPIYVDGFTVILLRKEEKNAALLQQYALDKNMFVSIPN